MRRNRAAIAAAAAILLLHTASAGAQTNPPATPPANLPANFPDKYPGPRCAAPEFEVLPQAEDPKTPDQAKTSLHDYEVRQYNREVDAYDACMRNYIAKANRDAAQIQAEANEAVKRITDSAKASIATIQAQIRKATANARKISNTPASALVGQ